MIAFPPTHRDTLVTEDGTSLHTQYWAPPGAPEALALLVHGYAEHCNRYGDVAHALVNRNVRVHAYDQRGYGRSGGRRAYVDTFDTYLDDLNQVLRAVRSQGPDRPLFLFGHSMGGLVVLKFVLNRTPSVRGLLLSAPALEINPDLAPLLRRVARLLGWAWPTLPTVRSPDDAISRDPAVVEEAEADPLNYHGRVLARTGAEMLRAGKETRARLHALRTPFLVVHGTADTLTSPRWSQELYERAGTSDKTLQFYEGLYHETFHEPEKDSVLTDLVDWLNAHLP
ncbi:MAG: alpha/beta hydrolase [Bacteroidetes bacterium SW_9_63_38]|nr:MAG: alpha/beta hydrolase [Bacteroidetes bacterium SW_9_63_38]